MIIGQQNVLFALTQGVDGDGNSIVGHYRVAIVVDASSGVVGTSSANYTLNIIPLPTDSGADVYYVGATHAVPTAVGPYPTGTPGTWIEPSSIASYWRAS